MRRLLALLLLLPSAAWAQRDFSDVVVAATDLGGGVHMLTGAGGNMALAVGPRGGFLVDDQFAPLTDKIKAAVKGITDQPVRYVVNTHWHGDHTGGNENFGASGSVIVAHEGVRARMSVEQFTAAFDRTVPPSPEAALPVITFDQRVTFHWGQPVVVQHVAPAHTDGDSIVHFQGADVFHLGDTFFNGFYPFIDTSSGGTLAGVIASADRVLAAATETTKIIPGHGPLASKADLQAYRDMLAAVQQRIVAAKAAGKTKAQVIASKPSADFDAAWGGGFLPPDKWIGLLYDAVP